MHQLASTYPSSNPLANMETQTPHIVFRTVTVRISGELARVPDFLPLKNWYIERWGSGTKGYIRYGNCAKHGIKKGRRMHREVIARLLGRPLRSNEHVHHQDFDKLHNCPCNLILLDPALNPSSACRHPYTGQFISPELYKKEFANENRDDAPAWVTEI